MTINLILSLFAIITFFDTIFAITVSLNGNDWYATNQNKSLRVVAKVPGSVYTDLMRNNVLKEDPYYGTNDFNYKWVAFDNWTYDKTFNVDETIINKKGVYLVCHGLDTVSKIYINQVMIGTTDNMFVRYKFDIKRHLRLGQNTITVSFESALTYAKRLHDQHVRDRYIVPPETTPFAQRGDLHGNYIRKMQSSFSWDWGPSFPTQGIWKDIVIEAYDSAIIRDIKVDTIPINSNRWHLNITLHLESIYNTSFDGLVQIFLYNTELFRSRISFVVVSDGSVTLSLPVPINESIVIHEWYPNGMGSQMLYNLRAIVTTNEDIVHKDIRIGFRKIELIQDPIQPRGLTFYFKVNGKPMYAKGSNWIPAHVFPELLTTEYIRNLLQSVREANMNMLRVWGGGIYEDNEFYQMADEMGIFIWHDFMFACALYPVTNDFLNSVAIEITQQVRRLQHHPSIALWAGNNENEAALAQFWWPEILVNGKIYKKDYLTLYVNVIREIVIREDNSGIYLTSSPSNGLETIRNGWLSNSPQDNAFGDVHFYYYHSDAWDWTRYPNTRFSSEYGFQSFPSVKSLSKVVNISDLRYPLSDAISIRQHHTNGNNEIYYLIEKNMKLPVAGGIDRLADYIYLSQIAQSMSLKAETEFYRRNRNISTFNGEGFTMGALYWQLNDIWQTPSWSSIEFGGKWKMAHYFVKTMFDNLLVVPYEDKDVLKVTLIRDDYSGDIPMNLKIKVFKWSSLTPLLVINNIVMSRSMSALMIYENKTSEVLRAANCVDRNQCVIEVTVDNQQNNWQTNNFLLLSPLKDAFGLKDPKIRIIQVSGPHNYTPDYVYDIVLHTENIALFVWLDFTLDSDILGEFSENGFLLSNEKKFIRFYSKNPIEVDKLKSQLIIKTLANVKTQ
ncbi:beta-mannosidase-like [Oppia nitens]|uniref:beta-mannosidase-like n=1 Tax=Oppia nitens TaxID=1686743 RepID=UPI0023D98863|nr:beta-mannosidase-like [Oppia nitens]